MKLESRAQLNRRKQRQLSYRSRPSNKRKKRDYDRKRYAAGNVRPSTWAKNHPRKAKRSRRDWFLRNAYGISFEEYQELLETQRHQCGVCGVKHTSKKPLHVDHCHRTKRIRGLLCFKCNTALGKLGDSIKLVNKLVTYLSIFNRRIGRRLLCV